MISSFLCIDIQLVMRFLRWLLLTLHEKINNIKDVKVIGYITDKEEGKMLQTRDGGCFDLKSQAWPIPNS